MLRLPTPRTPPALRINDSHHSWCTGKDSNLRTSLGGTDLQSVGFNHSPTCAENQPLAAAKVLSRRLREDVMQRINKNRKPSAHKTSVRTHTHLEMLPYGVLLGKTLYAAAPRYNARLPQNRSWSWRRDLNP